MKATIDDIVMKLFDELGLAKFDHAAKLSIQWDRFVAIFSTGPGPAYGSLRTIREKWRMLHALGYLKQNNQHSSSVNVQKIFGEVVPRARPEILEAEP